MEFRADRWIWVGPRAGGHILARRGADHGAVRHGRAVRLTPQEATRRWVEAGPVHVRGALGEAFRESRASIARSRAMFERLRDGGLPEREVWRRCPPRGAFEPAGASVDLGDDREIEKVHANLRRRGRPPVPDLWAKLSWITRDPRDESLRIRFSFGSERLDDWRADPARALAADAFAEAVFPECRLLTHNRPFLGLLRRWTGRGVRLSERIVFANAPGGGAVFHHDAEEGQRGVVYTQMAGRTAWLALPKRTLAGEAAALATGALARRMRTPAKAMRALDARDAPDLERLLNRSRRLTRRLAETGHLYVLGAGDVLLLPSHGPDDAAWHSVFALGKRPSLAHSYGIFAVPKNEAT